MYIKEDFKLKSNYDVINGYREIDFLVFHHIEAQNINKSIDLLKLHKVSSHYIIDDNGDIYRLVDDNDVAFHAGCSFFKGIDGLNSSSIGIELFSTNAYQKGFSDQQYQSLIALSKSLMSSYDISIDNVVGHSDIAYYPENHDRLNEIGLLDRKDDPSQMFNWQLMAQNNIALSPQINHSDFQLYSFGDSDQDINDIKLRLSNFGYKVSIFSNHFDIEMRNLSRVFNRRFNQKSYLLDPDCWWNNNNYILDFLLSQR